MGAADDQRIPGGRVAVLLGAVLLTGFAGLAWVSTDDAAHRKELETFDSPTAAGDPAVTLPQGWEPGPEAVPLVRIKGVLHYGEDIVDYSDGTMAKSGQDDTGQILLYQRIRRKGKERPDEWFIKIGPGRFLEIGPRQGAADPQPSPEAKPEAAAGE